MQRIIGVTPSVYYRGVLRGTEPSIKLTSFLESHGLGTRVGLGTLGPLEWDYVAADLQAKAEAEGVTGVGYEHGLRYYWERLITVCLNAGHDVHYLESKEAWLPYNQCMLDQLVEQKHDAPRHENEPEKTFLRRKLAREYDLFTLETLTEDWFFNERLHTLDENMHSVDISIVPRDFMHVLASRPGKDRAFIGFERAVRSRYGVRVKFKEDFKPDPRKAFREKCIARKMRLVEQGRIADGSPHYFGTTDPDEPWNGFFELYLDRLDDKIFHGRFESFHGSAIVEGAAHKYSMSMEVRYVDRDDQVPKTPIVFHGQNTEAGIMGTYSNPACPAYDGEFIMVPDKADPVDLGMKWMSMNVL